MCDPTPLCFALVQLLLLLLLLLLSSLSLSLSLSLAAAVVDMRVVCYQAWTLAYSVGQIVASQIQSRALPGSKANASADARTSIGLSRLGSQAIDSTGSFKSIA
jgi:hypothetical protein